MVLYMVFSSLERYLYPPFSFYCRSAPEHNYGTIVPLREGCRIVDNLKLLYILIRTRRAGHHHPALGSRNFVVIWLYLVYRARISPAEIHSFLLRNHNSSRYHNALQKFFFSDSLSADLTDILTAVYPQKITFEEQI